MRILSTSSPPGISLFLNPLSTWDRFALHAFRLLPGSVQLLFMPCFGTRQSVYVDALV